MICLLYNKEWVVVHSEKYTDNVNSSFVLRHTGC